MSKRFMHYLSFKGKDDNNHRIVEVMDSINQNTWPDGNFYFTVHEKSAKFHLEIQDHATFSENARIDKFPTFNETLMREILNVMIGRFKNREYDIQLSSSIIQEICKEAVSIVSEIKGSN